MQEEDNEEDIKNMCAEQRKKFLDFCLGMARINPEIKFKFHNGCTVKGELLGVDSLMSKFAVKNLNTHVGVYEMILIRSNDVCFFSL